MKKYIKLSFVLYLKRIKSVKRKVEMRQKKVVEVEKKSRQCSNRNYRNVLHFLFNVIKYLQFPFNVYQNQLTKEIPRGNQIQGIVHTIAVKNVQNIGMVEADLLVDLTGVTLRYQMEFTITNYKIMFALNILFNIFLSLTSRFFLKDDNLIMSTFINYGQTNQTDTSK